MKAITQEITQDLLDIFKGSVIIAAMLAVVLLMVYTVMGFLAPNESSASPPPIWQQRGG
jgi:hypothetical protein